MGAIDHDRGSDGLATLGERLKLDWQNRVAFALAESGSRPPRHSNDTARTPFEELAAAAVEAIWPDVEPLLHPVFDIASRLGARSAEPLRTPVARPPTDLDESMKRSNPWMDADEAASMLNLTPHTLRRLARDGRCPVVVRRIGGRWRFARSDVARFVAGEPPTLG